MDNAEKMLEGIFEITQRLYQEMCEQGTDTSEEHFTIFELLTDLGKTLVNSDRASFWKWDKRSHELWTTAQVGTTRITIPEDTGLVGKALREGRAIVTNDPYNEPDFNAEVDKKTGYVTKSILVMPVTDCKGECIGAYQAINKIGDDGKFNLEEDVKRLSLATFICGITLESEVFLDNSQHDKLTGLKNRMGFYSDFNRSFSKLIYGDEKELKKLSMFICDIDKFKSVNDTYGHNAGDAVLRHVAGIFEKNCRGCDGVYRWGGEEFIMVFPETGLDEAVELAEKFRLLVQESVCEFEDLKIKCTVSFGCAEMTGDKTIEENVQVADGRLYVAKESGRNRVVYVD